MIVVDTNLPVYLYVEGPKTGEAEEVLRRDPEWIVPPLWQPEFLNVMCLYVRQGILSEEDTAYDATYAALGRHRNLELVTYDREIISAGLHLGPLEEKHFVTWVEHRLRTGLEIDGDVGKEVVRLGGPRTQDVVQIARQLYFRGLAHDRPVRVSDVGEAMDDVTRSEDPLIRSLWNEISGHQQDVLRVVALGADQLYSSEVRNRFGLPAPSSVKKAVDALIARGLLVSVEGRIRFDSPFVHRWVHREAAPDLG